MNKKGFKIELFTISHLDGKIKANKLSDAKIMGKLLFISTLQENFKSDNEEFYQEYTFDYSYQIPFDKKISLHGGKMKKMNVKIIYPTNETKKDWEQICYTHLSCLNKLRNSFNFNKIWLLQPNNLMWIINMIIILLVSFITMFKKHH